MVALEPGRDVPYGQAGDEAGVDAGPIGKDQPRQGPVDHPHPVDVPGADGEVRFSPFHGLDQAGEVAGVVGEIGIHLADEIVPLRQREPKTGDVGRTQTLLACALHQVQPIRKGGLSGTDFFTGAVGRTVVHDQERRTFRKRHDQFDDRVDVLRFVVGRRDDECLPGRNLEGGWGSRCQRDSIGLRDPAMLALLNAL